MQLIDLYNKSLAYMGQAPIIDIDIRTQETTVMNLQLPAARELILSRHPWSAFVTRKRLRQAPCPPDFGYSAQFPKPANLVAIISINGEEWQTQTQFARIEGNMILANADHLDLVYIRDEPCIETWPDNLADLLSRALAVLCTIKINADQNLKIMLEQDYEMKLNDMILLDSINSGGQRYNYAIGLLSGPDPLRIG